MNQTDADLLQAGMVVVGVAMLPALVPWIARKFGKGIVTSTLLTAILLFAGVMVFIFFVVKPDSEFGLPIVLIAYLTSLVLCFAFSALSIFAVHKTETKD